jgi:hypothetical protein
MSGNTSRSHQQPGSDYRSKANCTNDFGNTSQEHDEWRRNPASGSRLPTGFMHYQSCGIKPQTTLPLRGADVNGCCRVVDITDGDPSHADTLVPPPTWFSLPKDGTIPDAIDMQPPYWPSSHHGTSGTVLSEDNQLGPACLQGVEPIIHRQCDTLFKQEEADLAAGKTSRYLKKEDMETRIPESSFPTAAWQSCGATTSPRVKRRASPLPTSNSDASQFDKRQKPSDAPFSHR